jgi:hypothetical protein
VEAGIEIFVTVMPEIQLAAIQQAESYFLKPPLIVVLYKLEEMSADGPEQF